MRLAHTSPAPWPAIKPGRFAAAIRHDEPAGCRIALLGLPDDTGVRLNGGRFGAAQGPAAFRAALAGYGTPWDGRRGAPLDAKVFDAGDVVPAPGDDERALLATHERVESAVRELHQLGLLPVCIGGGHDLALPAVAALSAHARAAVAGINLDAHLDVRERIGSGMPFRRLIESGKLDARRFAEVGLGRFANDEADLRWAKERGATLLFTEDVLDSDLDSAFDAIASSEHAFVSVDLDALDGSEVPGVSALNPLGLSVRHAAQLAERAGALPNVSQFHLMELSPPHDPSGRSARVAAHLFLAFLAGFCTRSP